MPDTSPIETYEIFDKVITPETLEDFFSRYFIFYERQGDALSFSQISPQYQSFITALYFFEPIFPRWLGEDDRFVLYTSFDNLNVERKYSNTNLAFFNIKRFFDNHILPNSSTQLLFTSNSPESVLEKIYLILDYFDNSQKIIFPVLDYDEKYHHPYASLLFPLGLYLLEGGIDPYLEAIANFSFPDERYKPNFFPRLNQVRQNLSRLPKDLPHEAQAPFYSFSEQNNFSYLFAFMEYPENRIILDLLDQILPGSVPINEFLRDEYESILQQQNMSKPFDRRPFYHMGFTNYQCSSNKITITVSPIICRERDKGYYIFSAARTAIQLQICDQDDSDDTSLFIVFDHQCRNLPDFLQDSLDPLQDYIYRHNRAFPHANTDGGESHTCLGGLVHHLKIRSSEELQNALLAIKNYLSNYSSLDHYGKQGEQCPRVFSHSISTIRSILFKLQNYSPEPLGSSSPSS